MKPELSLHGRTLQLQRYPVRQNETLQAWDAADEYLINYVSENYDAFDPDRPILLMNDSFGALGCWYSQYGKVVSVTDSFIAKQATLANLNANQLDEVTLSDCLAALPEAPQLVLLKLPKNNRLLSWQLRQLCQSLPAGTMVIAAAKAKEIHTSTLKLFEKYLGDTKTSLAVKKARLIFCQVNPELSQPLPAPLEWQVQEHGLTLTNHANVFSGESLDIGARFFLEHLPADNRYEKIVDLGCGNGVIGIKAAQLNPDAKIVCVDESFMAAASCHHNANINLSDPSQLTAVVNNCLEGMPADDTDLVLCNPPFHQQNTITDHIAWQMFCDARHVLRQGGKLWVIGNRHLGYNDKLKRLFGNVTVVAQNNKFVIYQSTKS